MISETDTLMSRYCNGAWAGHMCFCVHFCGVFVCIWGHFYVHLGGVFVGILWLFCVHFSQFCDLMGIQVYITSVYDIMWLIYLRPGWQNTFPPFDTYWINNVTNVEMAHQDRIKLKINSCICDLKCGQITQIVLIYVLSVHRPFPIVSFLTNGHF